MVVMSRGHSSCLATPLQGTVMLGSQEGAGAKLGLENEELARKGGGFLSRGSTAGGP